ncbi:MAG TPA: HDOD domain-containing protein, partial [Anaerolineae bacterium]|nr:HDOD domain-containing protein [Anaerolineae bacterium]
MSGIEDILSQINYLPPFPLTVTRVLQMLRDSYVKTDDIVGVVKFDQAIATHVLKLCNSSFFGLRRPITNLRDAVVYIGLSNLKKIIIISGTRQYFEKQQSAYELKKGELWRHAIAVSILAEKLNNMFDRAPIDDVYISGLLHDVGKLVLSKFVMEVSEEMTHMVEQRGISFLEAEKTILGIDHAEVGAKILDKWKFSEEIISSVKKHHMPLDEDDS